MYNVEDLVYFMAEFRDLQKFKSQKTLPRPAVGPEENRTWPLPNKTKESPLHRFTWYEEWRRDSASEELRSL
jgi:hypothetical protein